jgi:hypothetical protein
MHNALLSCSMTPACCTDPTCVKSRGVVWHTAHHAPGNAYYTCRPLQHPKQATSRASNILATNVTTNMLHTMQLPNMLKLARKVLHPHQPPHCVAAPAQGCCICCVSLVPVDCRRGSVLACLPEAPCTAAELERQYSAHGRTGCCCRRQPQA